MLACSVLAQTTHPCSKSGKFNGKKKDVRSEWVHSQNRVWIPLSRFPFLGFTRAYCGRMNGEGPHLLYVGRILTALTGPQKTSLHQHQEKRKDNKKPKKYKTMPQIVNLGPELLRINIAKNSIEVSQNGGRSWVVRYSGGNYGVFRDLLPYGAELLACTSQGLYVSANQGRSFVIRCNNSSYGEFLNLQNAGSELLANTTKGLYYSRNAGRSWVRR